MESSHSSSCAGIVRNGQVVLTEPANWPDGTKLRVTPVFPVSDAPPRLDGHVIIVGFGLAGRYIADLLDSLKLPYRILERNPATVSAQRALGRHIVQGDTTDEEAMHQVDILHASVLALTIPHEESVLQATAIARRLQSNIHILARTNYSSQGMKASQLGADDVVKAEQAVAVQFHEKLLAFLKRRGATS